MHDRLFLTIREHQLLRAGDRVGVAVSGGADSVALLRLLLEIRERLGVVLTVVHFNHQLRGSESDRDEQFVRELAEAHGLEFFSASGDTRAYAAERKCGIEAAAREMRYEFFRGLLGNKRSLDSGGQTRATSARDDTAFVDRIVTAHTMDDQAETVVLRFVRGAGTRGLAGIHPVLGKNKRSLDSGGQKQPASARDDTNSGDRSSARDDMTSAREDRGAIVRPLLEFRRAQLRHYLRRGSQPWREDASNQDTAFARNRVRQEVMPKLREMNPAIEQVLSETAEIARAEEEFWDTEVARRIQDCAGERTLHVDKLLALPVALQRRVLRAFAERHGLRLEFHHVQQVLEVARERPTRAEKKVELPDDWDATVLERELRLEKRCRNTEGHDYELPFPVPGGVEVPAAGLVLRAEVGSGAAGAIDFRKLSGLRVRNWRPGDRYWPAHTREAKKVKELLQDHRIPAGARAHWPVVVAEVDGQEAIVWVPGFAYPESYLQPDPKGMGLRLEHGPRE